MPLEQVSALFLLLLLPVLFLTLTRSFKGLALGEAGIERSGNHPGERKRTG